MNKNTPLLVPPHPDSIQEDVENILSKFRWSEDLVDYNDRPLVSVFEDISVSSSTAVEGTCDKYLGVWCDKDDTHDRWFFALITDEVLAAIKNSTISLRQAMLAANFPMLLLVDLREGKVLSQEDRLFWLHKDNEYTQHLLPEPGVFLKHEAASNGLSDVR